MSHAPVADVVLEKASQEVLGHRELTQAFEAHLADPQLQITTDMTAVLVKHVRKKIQQSPALFDALLKALDSNHNVALNPVRLAVHQAFDDNDQAEEEEEQEQDHDQHGQGQGHFLQQPAAAVQVQAAFGAAAPAAFGPERVPTPTFVNAGVPARPYNNVAPAPPYNNVAPAPPCNNAHGNAVPYNNTYGNAAQAPAYNLNATVPTFGNVQAPTIANVSAQPVPTFGNGIVAANQPVEYLPATQRPAGQTEPVDICYALFFFLFFFFYLLLLYIFVHLYLFFLFYFYFIFLINVPMYNSRMVQRN
jgi:hypothetical protein